MLNGFDALAFLAFLSVAYTVATSSMERLRLAVSGRHVSSMLGVTTFAGVVALPAHFSLALVAVAYAGAWPTFKRARAPLHRHAYNAGSVAVACVAAGRVVGSGVPPLLAIPAGIATFMGVNLALVAAAIAVAGDARAWKMLANPRTYTVVATSQVAGALVGEAVHWHTIAGLMALPLLLVVHRDALRGTLQDTAACVDGIWNLRGWTDLAEEAERRGELFSVVVVEASASDMEWVIAALRSHVEHGDRIGRYTESCAVLFCAEAPAAAVRHTGRRIAELLTAQGMPVGVGTADSRTGSLGAAMALASAEASVRRGDFSRGEQLR
jgi:hypothetical protein